MCPAREDPKPHARRPTARASSLCIVRPRAAAARGTAPHIPPFPATASTEPRTVEFERHERRVLLERRRQSSRAVVADLIACGSHSTQPTQQASRRQEEEPRARQGDPTPHARRPLHARACSASCARARPPAVGPRHTSPLSQPPRAQSSSPVSLSVSSVVFFSSDAARALAPSSPILMPAACTATNQAQIRASPLLRSSVFSVEFFSSDAARALAPSSPMPFPAARKAPNPRQASRR
jgi:hypothetical protein